LDKILTIYHLISLKFSQSASRHFYAIILVNLFYQLIAPFNAFYLPIKNYRFWNFSKANDFCILESFSQNSFLIHRSICQDPFPPLIFFTFQPYYSS